MSALLHRLGKWCSHRAKTVLGAWLVLIGILAALVSTTGLNLTDAFKIDNAESIQGMEVLQERLPQAAGTSNQVLFSADTGTILDYQEEIADFVAAASTIAGVAMVTDPFSELTPTISENKKHALLQIMGDKSVGSQMSGPTPESTTTAQALKELVAITAAENPGLEINMAENIGHFISVPLSLTELIGVGIAALVLIATFGFVLAAGAPILSAFIGVGAGMLVVLGAANFAEINSTTPALAVMIGLAVGIDYALFIIARAREYILDGVDPREAAARANATAGSSVVFAGGTVIVALCGLSVSGIGFLSVMGISAAFVVFISVLVAITAVPAMLGLIGMKAISRRQRRKQQTAKSSNSASHRSPAAWWISRITRAPLITILGVVTILGLMFIPATKMTTALTDNGTEPVGTSLRTTYDKIGEYYGDGYNAPIVVIADIVQSTEPVELVNKLSQEIAQIDGVKKIQLATPNPDASIAFVQIIPEHGQADERTAQLVQDLRAAAPTWETELQISDVMITGATAVSIDIAEQLNSALIPFGIVVVGLSLILLMIVFRSIAVPITATIGYLLSLGAAFGAIGLVYGYGFGADILHVTKTGPVISFLPVMVMGILFGLAMDYQVFLVSRMREEWIRSGNAVQAVKQGFIGSSTVVVAAALIMASVFAAFIPEGSVQIKPIAIGLTVGIAADAFLVRMTLIPALMAWLGEKAWWLPSWIERSLPVVDVEGEGLHRTLEHEDWIAINGESQVRVSNLQIISHEDEIISNLSFALKNGELAVIRTEDRVARKALAATLTARLRPSSGIVAIGRNVLPDGTGLVQGQSTIIDRWNAPLPRHVQVVIIDDPAGRRWKRVSELLSEGKAVVVTGPRNLEVPEFIQVTTNQEIITSESRLHSRELQEPSREIKNHTPLASSTTEKDQEQ